VFEDLVVGVDPTRSAAALEEIRSAGGHVDRSDMDEGLANPGGAQL
jgi:nicotinamidase/pyrazinamidase